MSSCGTKAKAIMVVLVGLFGLLCVGFAVSVTEKYRVQKERVHALERQLGAGRKEILKVPELMENLDKVELVKKETEEKFTTCASEKEGLTTKVAELQKEVDTFGAIKAAVGVQLSGLQNTIQEQQNRLNTIEEERGKLMQQIASLEEESKEVTEKSELQVADMKRSQEELKNQLIYSNEAKKIAEQELAENKKNVEELQKAKEALEQELAKIKEQGPSTAPQTSPSETPSTSEQSPQTPSAPEQPHFPLMDSSAAEDLDKAFALLRERVSSPTMSLSEVSILLSRMENALKSLR